MKKNTIKNTEPKSLHNFVNQESRDFLTSLSYYWGSIRIKKKIKYDYERFDQHSNKKPHTPVNVW